MRIEGSNTISSPPDEALAFAHDGCNDGRSMAAVIESERPLWGLLKRPLMPAIGLAIRRNYRADLARFKELLKNEDVRHGPPHARR